MFAWKLAEKAKMDKYSGQFDAAAFGLLLLLWKSPVVGVLVSSSSLVKSKHMPV